MNAIEEGFLLSCFFSFEDLMDSKLPTGWSPLTSLAKVALGLHSPGLNISLVKIPEFTPSPLGSRDTTLGSSPQESLLKASKPCVVWKPVLPPVSRETTQMQLRLDDMWAHKRGSERKRMHDTDTDTQPDPPSNEKRMKSLHARIRNVQGTDTVFSSLTEKVTKRKGNGTNKSDEIVEISTKKATSNVVQCDISENTTMGFVVESKRPRLHRRKVSDSQSTKGFTALTFALESKRPIRTLKQQKDMSKKSGTPTRVITQVTVSTPLQPL